jgi:hypothetical protein
VHAWSLRQISPFPGIVPGILSRESRGRIFNIRNLSRSIVETGSPSAETGFEATIAGL